jgi:tripartite-type tricarboxylate transporter receptor subunit TctC
MQLGKTSRVMCLVMVTLVGMDLTFAQAYPSGPMCIVVPFPPGGGTDIPAGSLAQKLNEAWAQPVIVDNRRGANGTIGAALVAKAPADGHTLIVAPSGFAVNPSIYKTLPFDALKDFAPITLWVSRWLLTDVAALIH